MRGKDQWQDMQEALKRRDGSAEMDEQREVPKGLGGTNKGTRERRKERKKMSRRQYNRQLDRK